MDLVNEIAASEAAMDSGEVAPATVAEVFRNLVLMLAPFAPFLAAELWEEIGGEGVVFRVAWPVADAELAREAEMEIPVQMQWQAGNGDNCACGKRRRDDQGGGAGGCEGCGEDARQDGGEGDCGAGQLVNIVVK